MPEAEAEAAAGGGGQGKVAAPEKQLNGFVRCVGLVERVGNAFGTLAFTWATVVLLGGYPTVLREDDDFPFATTIVFLEAARMFTRNNKLDYQLFFRTRGAFRPLGWNWVLIAIVYFSGALKLFWKYHTYFISATLVPPLLALAMLLAVGQFLSAGALGQLICKPLRRAISLWSPMLAVLLMCPSIPDQYYCRFYYGVPDDYCQAVNTIISATESISWVKWMTVKWMAYLALCVFVLLVTISRLRFTVIFRLLDNVFGKKIVRWRRVILNSCMLAAVMMLVYTSPGPAYASSRFTIILMIICQVCALVVVSFGNLQIPAAVVRVVLALVRLIPHCYYDDVHCHNIGDTKLLDTLINLVSSLNIFYAMVLGQGILYIVAGILEVFSFIPRRLLVRSIGFRGQHGVEYVDLYYTYAFEKCMGGPVLAPKKISLITFAMDALDSDLPKMQLYGVQMLHSFLQKEHTRTHLLPKLTSSAKTMARLMNMLEWASPNYTTVRLFAAKVTVELAKNIRVDTIPGTMQLVSALLDADGKEKRGNPLLDSDDDQEGKHDLILNIATHNSLDTPSKPTRQAGMLAQNSYILKGWKRILEFWPIPKELPLTDHDVLPTLGMSIIDNLAACDQGNCLEISKAIYLIPKIIRFTSYRSDKMYTEAQQQVMLESSLKVLKRLSCVDGEIGVTLRCNISKHLFLLRNLAVILGDDRSSQESRKLVAKILRNLAISRCTRDKIGRIQPIMLRLMQAFLNSEGPSSDGHLQRMASGQALAILTMENVHNCLVMLTKPEFIERVKTMILLHDKCMCVAASLLRNICLHARPNLKELDLEKLSHILREVLERIMIVEGAELEALIGLSSQICKLLPEEFARELENGQIKQRFVKRLVDTLNAYMKPSACCPGIRRVILEQAIYMEYNPHYASCFNECRMSDALLLVEETASEAENYMLFLGDVGLMEHSTPLSDLVHRAKELLSSDL